jgi:hypothetical protein
MKRMRRATPSTPSATWMMPYSRATGAITSAIAPVAAEIIAGRPPRKAIETAIVNDANSPTRGSTPAMIEKEIARE